MNDQIKHLANALDENNFVVDEATLDKLYQYLLLLQRWNKVYNLTAIVDWNEMVYLHIIDSLSILKSIKDSDKKLIDVGTGAGLPGIPLAIISPDHQWVLLDTNQKKINFLNQVKLELQLSNVETVKARVEEYHPIHCFDKIITRAFSSLVKMIQSTDHLLCKSGMFLAMKGVYPAEEIKELPENYIVNSVDEIKIKGLNHQRCIVSIKRRTDG